MSPMSIGGRSRVWSRVTAGDFLVRGAANAPVPALDCVTESFDQADSAIIGPDLTWLSSGAETHDGKFVCLSGSIPVTYTESFNTANGTTIGPDLSWSKTSFASLGTAGGVIFSDSFAVVGNPDSDGFAQCHIFLSNVHPSFNRQAVITIEATVAAKSVQGSGAGEVTYSAFYLTLGAGPSSFGAVAALFDNNGGDRVLLHDQSAGPSSAAISAVVPGDVLGLIVTPNSPGSFQATLEAQVNGITVLTKTNATGWDFAPPGLDLEISTSSPPKSFDADNQDRLDNFVASGEYTAANIGTAWTVDDPIPSDDVKVSATVGDFDDTGLTVQFGLFARIGGTSGPDDGIDNWYEARFRSSSGSSSVVVDSWWWGSITDQLSFTPALQAGDEIAFTITGSTDDFRLLCEVNGVTVLDWGAVELEAWNGVVPADFQTEDGFGPFTGRRAGLGIEWAGDQDANSLDNWSACEAPA